MKLLIIGGAGYIGSSLAVAATENYHQVTVVDNLMYHQGHAQFQNARSHNTKRGSIDFIKSDIRDFYKYGNVLKKADAVVNLAAIVGAPACEPKHDPGQKRRLEAIAVNAMAVLDLTMRMSKDQLLIVPNTNSGYGTTADGVECTEETPLNPVSLYGKTKMDAERFTLEHQRSVVLRLATVFGWSPRMRLDLIVNQFAYLAKFDRVIKVFDGGARRNFVAVSDVVDLILWCLDKDHVVGQVYNVGNDDINMSKLRLAGEVTAVIGGIVETGDGTDPDKRDYVVSSKKLTAAGFTCKTSLRSGLEELNEWMSMLPSDQEAREHVVRYMSTVCV